MEISTTGILCRAADLPGNYQEKSTVVAKIALSSQTPCTRKADHYHADGWCSPTNSK